MKRLTISAPLAGLVLVAGACLVASSVNRELFTASADPVTIGSREFPIRNDIDRLILARLREEKIEPSGLCTDEEFARRIHLDICGVIPSRAEVKSFLNDKNPDKRAKLIDALLKSERCADHFTVLWGDLLKEHTNSRQQEGTERGSYREWLQDALRKNKPYDQFVRELICSNGSPDENGAVNFYLRDPNNRVETVNTVATVFMGTRMACAQCHDHPFDKWQQMDFHHLMAFFGRTREVVDPTATMLKLEKERRLSGDARKILEPYFKDAHEAAKNESAQNLKLTSVASGGDAMMGGMAMASKGMGKAGEAMSALEKGLPKADYERARQFIRNNDVRQVFEQPMGEYRMPNEGDSQDKKGKKAGEVVEAVFPWDAAKKVAPTANRRKALADYIVSHRQFAAVQANRLWARAMGKGIVDPVDDFRAKNPATHPELLDYLAGELVKSKFDNHHVLRLIFNSSTYQRSSLPTTSNRADESLFSHQRVRRMTAEQLWDSILVASGQEKSQVDSRRQWAVDQSTPARTGSFMNEFNQPSRDITMTQRDESGSITQALELLNGQTLNRPISNSQLVKSLLDSKANASQVVAELYLAALSRNPTAEESRFGMTVLRNATPTKESVEDLMWALLNSREFSFVK